MINGHGVHQTIIFFCHIKLEYATDREKMIKTLLCDVTRCYDVKVTLQLSSLTTKFIASGLKWKKAEFVLKAYLF